MLDTSTSLPVDQRLECDQMNRSEFVTAMAHLYRGELAEATAWRRPDRYNIQLGDCHERDHIEFCVRRQSGRAACIDPDHYPVLYISPEHGSAALPVL